MDCALVLGLVKRTLFDGSSPFLGPLFLDVGPGKASVSSQILLSPRGCSCGFYMLGTFLQSYPFYVVALPDSPGLLTLSAPAPSGSLNTLGQSGIHSLSAHLPGAWCALIGESSPMSVRGLNWK